MTLSELIEAARREQKTLGKVAEQLGIHQTRLSEWKAGKYAPGVSTIAKLAELANLPVLDTVASVEAELEPAASEIWLRALGKLRAAGVAATVTMTVGTAALLGATPDANASSSLSNAGPVDCYVNLCAGRSEGLRRWF